jgi:hypothetical protein
MKIVRKLLSSDEISSPATRYDPEGDVVQVTPDGGTTWTDVPEMDARHSDAARLPALTGETAQCDAAERMMQQLKVTVDGFVAAVSYVEAVSFLFSVFIVLADGLGAVLYAVAYIVAAALGVIGVSTIAAAFTSEVWDGIKCIILANIGVDGQMSAGQLADIMTAIDAQYPGTVYNTLYQLRGLYGEAQLSNAGVVRTETGDCTACVPTWCHYSDFSGEELDGWTLLVGSVGTDGLFGAYGLHVYRPDIDSSGSPAYGVVLGIEREITIPVNELQALIGFTVDGPHPDGQGLRFKFGAYNGLASYGLGVHDVPLETIEAGTDVTGTLQIWEYYGFTGTPGGDDGTVIMPYCRLNGVGENPIGDENCP